MRAIRAARAGSRGDCCALAVTIALSERVRQEMAASVATAAKTTRSFFEFELMGENRITFSRRGISDWLGAEEIDEEFRDASGLFVLEPVRGVGKGVEFGAVAVAETVVGHLREEKGVALAP